MFSGDDTSALVGDAGSHTAKMGFGGEDTPRFIAAALPSSDVEARTVAAWTQGAKVLRVNLADHPLIMPCPTNASDKERAKLTEILVEKLQAPCVFVMRSAVLCAFAAGRSSALIVEAGASCSTVTAVHEGHALLRASRSSAALGGNALTAAVAKVLRTRDMAVADQCKHELVKVWRPLLFDDAVVAAQTPARVFELPDSTKVTFGVEQFKVCEDLFHIDAGLGALVYEAVAHCDAALRKGLLQEILVLGGSALLDGLAERIGADVAWRVPSAFKPRVSSPGSSIERRFSAFVGASVLSALGSFQQLWLSRAEYQEHGALKCVVERFVH